MWGQEERVMGELKPSCGKRPWVIFDQALDVWWVEAQYAWLKRAETLSITICLSAEQICIVQQWYLSHLSGLLRIKMVAIKAGPPSDVICEMSGYMHVRWLGCSVCSSQCSVKMIAGRCLSASRLLFCQPHVSSLSNQFPFSTFSTLPSLFCSLSLFLTLSMCLSLHRYFNSNPS